VAETRLQGGRLAPLDETDQEQIHEGVFDILETVGMAEAPR
tara:strand:- start:10864 stop:10986 length:123 start_codon:yes stop_codon:yes gene_type:complete